jgi:signal transduction histidine kinase
MSGQRRARVLEALLGLAQLRGIRLEFAVEPGLAIRMDRTAFREILSGLLTYALYAGTVQRVLLGAMRHAGRVQIAVVTDGSGPPCEDQAHALRPIVHLVSQQGGTLEIDARLQEGSTLLLRLPAPAAFAGNRKL